MYRETYLNGFKDIKSIVEICPELIDDLTVQYFYSTEKEEDPDYIFSGDAVFFHINETTFACSKTECNFVNRRLTENFYTHARKVFHIYAKGRTTTNDPIRYGDEVALFHRMNDEGYGLWLGCASGSRRCGLGTCPGFPHLNHWMWMGKHSCDENKFVIAGSTGLQNGTTSRQPVRIEHEIKLTTKSVSAWITGGKRNTEGNLPLLSETPLFQDLGKWVIKKGKQNKGPFQVLIERVVVKILRRIYTKLFD